MQTLNNSLNDPTEKTAQIIVSDGLQIFLSNQLHNRTIWVPFKGPQTIKHLVESIGIPHVEIYHLTVNGKIAGLADTAQDQDQIYVRAYQDVSNSSITDTVQREHRASKFVLDNHLGKLTAYLRMLGFDCLYEIDLSDLDLASISANQDRILLSRDRQLLMRKIVQKGYFVRSKKPLHQTIEIINRFNLSEKVVPFHRCLKCNHKLVPIEKSSILHRLQPKTRRYYDEFHHCIGCDQIYWKGSHYDKMCQIIEKISTQNRIGSKSE